MKASTLLIRAARISVVMCTITVSGCATLKGNLGVDPQVSFSSMTAEAQILDAMPRKELAKVIQEREHSSAFSDLKRTTIKKLAERIASDPDDQVPLRRPVTIEDPFVTGHKIHVSRNDDWSTNWKIANEGGFGILFAIGTPSIDNPHALNANLVEGAVTSFSDPSKPSFILLPERIDRATWGFSRPSDEVESIAFTLFHEAAHNHMAQEIMLHLGETNATSIGEAHHSAYKILAEVHSNVAATLAVNKAYDLDTQNLLDKLDTQIALERRNILASGMNGAPSSNHGMGQYRAVKAYEVIKVLAVEAPEFLKKMSFEDIPLAAYDISRSAAYHHNAAELLLETRFSKSIEAMADWTRIEDKSLLSAIKSSIPERKELNQAAKQLEEAWENYASRRVFKAYAQDLEAAIVLRDRSVPRHSMDYAYTWSNQHPVKGVDVKSSIEALAWAAKNENNSEKVFAQFRDTKAKIESALRKLPSSESISLSRESAMRTLQETLQLMDEEARRKDASSVIAVGADLDAEEIAKEILARYQG